MMRSITRVLGVAAAVAVVACSGSLVPWVTEPSGAAVVRGDLLEFTATTYISHDSVVVAATAINGSTRPIRLEWGACEVDVQLFRTADRTGVPAYDWAKRPPPPGFGAEACPMYLATRTLQPGESMSPPEFRVTIPLWRLGVDSLGVGTYFVTAMLHDMGVSVPAGSIELR